MNSSICWINSHNISSVNRIYYIQWFWIEILVSLFCWLQSLYIIFNYDVKESVKVLVTLLVIGRSFPPKLMIMRKGTTYPVAIYIFTSPRAISKRKHEWDRPSCSFSEFIVVIVINVIIVAHLRLESFFKQVLNNEIKKNLISVECTWIWKWMTKLIMNTPVQQR